MSAVKSFLRWASPTPGQEATTCIKLPADEDYGDFVEGTLQFGDETIRTYYEHSLSYLVLMSDSANTLRKIADRLAPLLQIAYPRRRLLPALPPVDPENHQLLDEAEAGLRPPGSRAATSGSNRLHFS